MGKVYLVGAGPGNPDLLTQKAARLLARADVVLYDALVSPEILALASPHARLVPVGKRCGKKRITQEGINRLLVDLAVRFLTVLRLKGGDPLLFGRAAEEMHALRAAGIPFEVVPGVTSACAAAAAAAIALTDRRAASQVLFTTAHRQGGQVAPRWQHLDAETTLVVYMPGSDCSQLRASLLSSGLDADTPCVIVSAASRCNERTYRTTVARLGSGAPLPAPTLIIVGEVARATPLRADCRRLATCHPGRGEEAHATEPEKDPYSLERFA